MPNITFENFYDEVKFFCHGQPKKASGLGEIITGINHPLADVWIAYAAGKGWPQRAAFFRKMLTSGNSLTMPCADPRKFDPEYKASGARRDDFRPEHVSEDVNERRSIADQVRQVVANAKPPKDRYRKGFEPDPEPVKTPAEFLAEAKANPSAPPMSDSLRGHLGLAPARQEAAE